MKVLWIVNTIFPAPSKAMGLQRPVFGGWMFGLAEKMGESLGIELAIAATYSGTELKKMNFDGICYYLLPCKNKIKYDTVLEQYWEEVCIQFQPELVHIHGTEYTPGLACMRKLPHLNYVISIQGLLSVIVRYYYAGISFLDILKNITFRDIVRWDTIFMQKSKFEIRGKFEKEYISRAKHVIGRTQWDYAHTKAINPNVNYHFCNESLRSRFYTAKKWSIENCDRHTIFLSQAGYPLKGLHQMIKAIVLLKAEFPSIKIRLGGGNITKDDALKDKIKLSGYGKYINSLLKEHGLINNVIFLGTLSEEQMIIEYHRAHVFVCPSSIENSPNSLGEAQLLGVPCIAAYTGGVMDMVLDGKTGLLYRFEEIEMLAEKIRSLFNDDEFTLKMSINGVIDAEIRHDQTINFKKTLVIYNSING